MKFRVTRTLDSQKIELSGVDLVERIVEAAYDPYEGGVIEELQAKIRKLTELVGVLLEVTPVSIGPMLDTSYAYKLDI